MLGVRSGEIKPGRSRSHGLRSHLNRQEKPEIFKPLPYRLELMPGSEIAHPPPRRWTQMSLHKWTKNVSAFLCCACLGDKARGESLVTLRPLVENSRKLDMVVSIIPVLRGLEGCSPMTHSYTVTQWIQGCPALWSSLHLTKLKRSRRLGVQLWGVQINVCFHLFLFSLVVNYFPSMEKHKWELKNVKLWVALV